MLEKYLVLNRYILSLFGIEDFRELQNKLRDIKEGSDSEGKSHFYNILAGLSGLNSELKNKLSYYDQNIGEYLQKTGRNINLKYYQYLAILFTEIYLDALKNSPQRFIEELNSFLRKRNEKKIEEFKEEYLNKLAYWMATGSGKTLIMHINYYQSLKYRLFDPDNIILITPNEALSKQHYEELKKSNIPAVLYAQNQNTENKGKILILEITKLTEEEKKGEGLSIPVEAFEGRNLVFIDEGHKGKREENKWANLRKKLSQNGFTFEYSATFGQIIDTKDVNILNEYAKSIIFDYSYKYFYFDGYGKKFYVVNTKNQQLDANNFEDFMHCPI